MASGEAKGDSRRARVLLVEDDRIIAGQINRFFAKAEHALDSVYSAGEALAYLEKRTPDLILLDLGLPDADGLDLVPLLKDLGEFISVVIMTGRGDPATVVEAMQRGADAFLPKPFVWAELLETVDRSLEKHRALKQDWLMRKSLSSGSRESCEAMAELVGHSPAIQKVRGLVLDIAETPSSVLILGDTGTGKGLLARAIHRLSRRAGGPFMEVNCANLPEHLVESELFGHEKGAFTNATAQKPGLLEVASGGTVFLDEIGELALPAQAKLLGVLENRTFRRVGGVREISTDVRFVVATHHALEASVAKGSFREDLYYRLNVFQIVMPRLSERGDDVRLLVSHFIERLNAELGGRVKGISPRAEQLLVDYAWPGNVREVRNVIERAMILARDAGRILPEHLPASLRVSPSASPPGMQSLAEVEREHIQRVLEHTRFNILRSSRILGISRSTLYAKMKAYRLAASDPADGTDASLAPVGRAG